jgi:hypothetical protein
MVLLLLACAAPEADPAADSAAMATARDDSIVAAAVAEAPTVRDTAKATLATLLDDASSATFDSVVVIQPPVIGDRVPGLAVCGRIGGRPGIGGSSVPVRFVYQGRFTVFVEEAENREQFADLWARLCAAPGATVVLEG